MLLSAPTSICKQQIHIQYQPGGELFHQGMTVTQYSTCSYSIYRYLQTVHQSNALHQLKGRIQTSVFRGHQLSILEQNSKQVRITHTHNTSTALFTLKHRSTQCCTRNKDTINSTCGSGVEPASYQKGTGPIPTVCMSKCPWARTPNCSWCAGRHHQCMNVCMNYCKVLWTKASA